MGNVTGAVAVVSTLISSIALVGVAVGLILQARHLQTARRQAARSTQAELVRMAMDYPELWIDPTDSHFTNPEDFRRATMINWQMVHLEHSYVITGLPDTSLRLSLAKLFASRFRREWWSLVREGWHANRKTRQERRFVALVDEEFRLAVEASQVGTGGQSAGSGNTS